MEDKITLSKIELLHPNIREEVKEVYKEIVTALSGRAICRFTQTLRTFEEQNALYAKGRTAPGKVVTNARAGSSYHNYGLAIDFALLVDKDGNGSFESLSYDMKADFDKDSKSDFKEVVLIFQEFGYDWGGLWKHFPDYPHFQKTFGYSVRQLLQKHNKKDFIPGTSYVNI